MSNTRKHNKLFRAPAVTISLLYFSFGMAWINVSDLLVYTFSESPSAEQITQFQTFKGFFFIGITALLLYTLSIRYLNKLSRSELKHDELDLELETVYASTSDGMAKVELDGTISKTNNNFREMTGLQTGNKITDRLKDSGTLLSEDTLISIKNGTINDHMGTTANYKVVVTAARDQNYEPLYLIVSVS